MPPIIKKLQEPASVGTKLVESKYFQVPSLDELRSVSATEAKEKIFQVIIFNKLLKVIDEDFESADFSDESVDHFSQKLMSLSEEEIKCVISLPASVREAKMKEFYNNSENENEAVDKYITFALQGIKYGFTLGYHCSKKLITPERNGEWVITGTEYDDRDEKMMAYYSLDYENFYRKKPADFIYFVRGETGQNSSHKQDTSNRWGRATNLSIVGKVSLREVDQLVNSLLEEIKQNGQ